MGTGTVAFHQPRSDLRIEPAGEEGAIYNAAEWLLENIGGDIVISSQPGRRCAIERLGTGLRGSIEQNARGEMRLHVRE